MVDSVGRGLAGPSTAASSELLALVQVLNARVEEAQCDARAKVAASEAAARSSLLALETAHAAEVASLRGEAWRLQDAMSLLQRQLSDVAAERTAAQDRAMRMAERLVAVEEDLRAMTMKYQAALAAARARP